jgi:hypothetical protein
VSNYWTLQSVAAPEPAKKARQMLTKIYKEFSEGFNTFPLVEARNVLGQLGR